MNLLSPSLAHFRPGPSQRGGVGEGLFVRGRGRGLATRCCLILVAGLLCCVAGPGAQAATLVAAYGFNEGSGTVVSDASGNGNSGTINGATWTTSGKYGNALSFNGSNALVTVNNAPSLQLTSAMTLEAWVYPTNVNSAWRDVIYKGNDNYYLEGTSTNSSRPAAGAIFGGVYGEVYGTNALTANTWSHLAATYDGATMRLYVNGVQVASRAQTGAIATSTNPLQIGGDSIYGQYFAGRIDEVRVYNQALNQTLSRTIITSGTVFLATMSLFIFGGGPINDFAFTFLVGIITGTYSSIYIASALVLWWHKGERPNIGASQVTIQNSASARV